MRRRRPLILTIGVVCIVIALVIAFVGPAGRDASPPDTAVVTRGDLLITAPVRGNLEAPDKAHLSFGATGTVKEVLVARGDAVEKGQVLASLDAPSLNLAVEAAQLQVQIAKSQLSAAQAQYDRAGEGWELPEGWEFLEEALEFLLGLLGPDEDMARASLDMAKLNLKMAELNLKSAKLNLDKAVIAAPFAGVVADITISEGQELSAPALAAPAISVVDVTGMQMRGFIDELDIAAVRPDQDVSIRLDALRDRELEGRVAFVSLIGTVRLGVVSYETIIALEGSLEGLRDGMSATADIIIERRDNVLLVPNRAIRGTREDSVVVVFADGRLDERQIVLGLTDGIRTEVLSGLDEGEKVVVGVLPPPEEQRRGPFGIFR